MSKIRVGVPSFISVRPLIYGLLRSSEAEVEVSYAEPPALVDGLTHGTLDCSLIPSIEYLRDAGHCCVNGVALVAKPAHGSLLLATKKPIREIERIAVGEFSRSPIALARIVLGELENITPDILVEKNTAADWRENYDAMLFSGDHALQYTMAEPLPDVEVHNIAGMWYSLAAKPLVVGLWAYRDAGLAGQFNKHLIASRNLGVQNLSRLADGLSHTTQFESEFLYGYLSGCWDYNLGEEEIDSLRTLEEFALRYDLIREGRMAESGVR